MVAAPPVPVVYPTGTQPALLPPPHVLIMLWLLPQPCQLLWMTMSLWLLLQVTTQSLLLALGIIFLRLIATLPSALNSFITLLSLKLEAVIWLMMIQTLNVTIGRYVLLAILLIILLDLKPYRTLLLTHGTTRHP